MMTAEYLRTLLAYDPDTGEFTWRVNHSNGDKRIGTVAGYRLSQGHWRIKIARVAYMAHRLAWLYMTGEWPRAQIDHINLVRDDNRWHNLRQATPSQNKANQHRLKNNKSGLKGVSMNHGKWRASLKIDGVSKHLGSFNCPAAAHLAYVVWADKQFGEFARAQ